MIVRDDDGIDIAKWIARLRQSDDGTTAAVEHDHLIAGFDQR